MNVLPNHIGIIMDGNGRWAIKRGLPRNVGHKEGLKTVGKIVLHAQKCGVKYLSLYVFSTENWKRSKSEVEGLFALAENYLKSFEKRVGENVKIIVSGSKEKLPQSLIDLIEKIRQKNQNNSGLTLNLCINYGGRSEIVDCVNKLLKSGVKEITENDILNNLYTHIPEPDIIVRTGGQVRLSNFLLYQCAYSELYFCDILWPDFTIKDFDNVLDVYSKRVRNFGGINK